jgi:hypothetical protein
MLFLRHVLGLQGIRPARMSDLQAIQQLLAPLEAAGITKKRTREQLAADISNFTVVERESKVSRSQCLFLSTLAIKLPPASSWRYFSCLHMQHMVRRARAWSCWSHVEP